MRMCAVEVLGVKIKDQRIQELLDGHQHQVVRTNIELATAAHNLDVQKQTEQINQEQMAVRTETEKVKHELAAMKIAFELTTSLKAIESEVARFEAEKGRIQVSIDNARMEFEAGLLNQKQRADLEAETKARLNELERQMIEAHTAAVTSRFNAAQGGFSEALLALSSNEVVAKVAEAMSVQHFVGGKTFVDVVQNVFQGSALEPVIGRITERVVKATAMASGNGETPPRPRA